MGNSCCNDTTDTCNIQKGFAESKKFINSIPNPVIKDLVLKDPIIITCFKSYMQNAKDHNYIDFLEIAMLTILTFYKELQRELEEK